MCDANFSRHELITLAQMSPGPGTNVKWKAISRTQRSSAGILIGLTSDETREFERLDELMSNVSFVPTDDSRSLNERRWLVLYDKHEAAVRIYLSVENSKALRASRTE